MELSEWRKKKVLLYLIETILYLFQCFVFIHFFCSFYFYCHHCTKYPPLNRGKNSQNISFRFYGILLVIWCTNRSLVLLPKKSPFIENMVLSYDMRIIWNIKLVWGKKYTPFTIHFKFVCDEFCENVICRLASVCLFC